MPNNSIPLSIEAKLQEKSYRASGEYFPDDEFAISVDDARKIICEALGEKKVQIKKVFAVQYSAQDDWSLYGIYLSEKRADREARNANRRNKTSDYEVQEYEIEDFDEAPEVKKEKTYGSVEEAMKALFPNIKYHLCRGEEKDCNKCKEVASYIDKEGKSHNYYPERDLRASFDRVAERRAFVKNYGDGSWRESVRRIFLSADYEKPGRMYDPVCAIVEKLLIAQKKDLIEKFKYETLRQGQPEDEFERGYDAGVDDCIKIIS